MNIIRAIEVTIDLIYNSEEDGKSKEDIIKHMMSRSLVYEEEELLTMEEVIHKLLSIKIEESSFRFVEVFSVPCSKKFVTITIALAGDLNTNRKVIEEITEWIASYIEEFHYKNVSFIGKLNEEAVYFGWPKLSIKE